MDAGQMPLLQTVPVVIAREMTAQRLLGLTLRTVEQWMVEIPA